MRSRQPQVDELRGQLNALGAGRGSVVLVTGPAGSGKTALLAEAASLAEGASRTILLRTTSRTSAETVALLTRFWSRLGFTATFAPDAAEAGADR